MRTMHSLSIGETLQSHCHRHMAVLTDNLLQPDSVELKWCQLLQWNPNDSPDSTIMTAMITEIIWFQFSRPCFLKLLWVRPSLKYEPREFMEPAYKNDVQLHQSPRILLISASGSDWAGSGCRTCWMTTYLPCTHTDLQWPASNLPVANPTPVVSLASFLLSYSVFDYIFSFLGRVLD